MTHRRFSKPVALPVSSAGRLRFLFLAGPSRFILLGWLTLVITSCGDDPASSGDATTSDADAVTASTEKFCASCHKFPPPDTLPRDQWATKVQVMYEIARGSGDTDPAGFPPIEDVTAWYVERAPRVLRSIDSTVEKGPGKLRLQPGGLRLKDLDPFPAVANVKFVHLFDKKRLDVLITDLRTGLIFVMRPYLAKREVKLLGSVKHPCTSEVVDLDGDGNLDLLVCELGTPTPSDATDGALFWFRGDAKKTFTVIPLLEGLGRVAHAQAADFDGDGDQDIVLAVFGWRKVGDILLLENETEDWSKPRFTPYKIDPRPGTIHVPVVDLNGDGHPDFVALISQHHETVVAFLNNGRGSFTQQVIFTASHPNWGSTGIQVIDMDGDKDLDVLFSNGDTLDDLVVKPYHGLQWLENKGSYPFVDHRLSDLYGCNAAKAADMDGDGDLDIAACVFLPYIRPNTPGANFLDSIVWFEQTSPGRFERFSIERMATLHPTLDLGDFDADGDIDLVVGNMVMKTNPEDVLRHWAIVWTNLER